MLGGFCLLKQIGCTERVLGTFESPAPRFAMVEVMRHIAVGVVACLAFDLILNLLHDVG